jgi:hypothetical protein
VNLYELATQYRADADKLATLDLDDATLNDTLDGLGGDLQTKATNTVAVARNLEALSGAIKDAEEQMKARRKALENRAAAIRAWVLRSMQAGQIDRIETPLLRIRRVKNPDKVAIDAPSQIPAKYFRFPDPPPPELDKRALLVDMKAGVEVPGAHLESTERLEID